MSRRPSLLRSTIRESQKPDSLLTKEDWDFIIRNLRLCRDAMNDEHR